jgi:hypothetical protein
MNDDLRGVGTCGNRELGMPSLSPRRRPVSRPALSVRAQDAGAAAIVAAIGVVGRLLMTTEARERYDAAREPHGH